MTTRPSFSELSYLSLPPALYKRQKPTPVSKPGLVIFNYKLAQEIGLDIERDFQGDLAAILSGNTLPPWADPFAQAYAGHQFGQFTMLGDGRAIMLKEHETPTGQLVDIQLKGAGLTPFSRNGDGRAALGPMLREYVISEAMQALGVPTTRSLAVVTTGEQVRREKILEGAILARVAASHLRVGTFELASVLNDKSTLKALFDYTVKRHYPGCAQAQNPALELLNVVAAKQARLIVDWMRIGFIHGVMNTDNMAISGETIDYGPCAFMDSYSLQTVFSSIDYQGRYAYGNQPLMAVWNLACLANALLPLISDNRTEAVKLAEAELQTFNYAEGWLAMMRNKLGLLTQEKEDEDLIRELLTWMEQNQADYTNTFRALSNESWPQSAKLAQEDFKAWHQRWQKRLERNNAPVNQALAVMSQVNPAYIPRNHLVEAMIQRATEHDDFEPFNELVKVISEPYLERPGLEKYQAEPAPHEVVRQTFCGT